MVQKIKVEWKLYPHRILSEKNTSSGDHHRGQYDCVVGIHREAQNRHNFRIKTIIFSAKTENRRQETGTAFSHLGKKKNTSLP